MLAKVDKACGGDCGKEEEYVMVKKQKTLSRPQWARDTCVYVQCRIPNLLRLLSPLTHQGQLYAKGEFEGIRH